MIKKYFELLGNREKSSFYQFSFSERSSTSSTGRRDGKYNLFIYETNLFEFQIENNVNLMTVSGTTPGRYLLAIARIVLTPDQFNNGYLPDFHGDRTGRVPISQKSADTLRGFFKYLPILSSFFLFL